MENIVSTKVGKEIKDIAAYSTYWIINLKTVHDLQTTHIWIDQMEEPMKIAKEVGENLARRSKPFPSPIEVCESNDCGTKIQIS